MRLASRDAVNAAWAAAAAPQRSHQLVHPDGDVLLTIDHDEREGFLVETPFHGRFHVDALGGQVRCAPLAEAGTSWHGLLIGQVLPLAATLRGYEIFHAGAVVAPGGRAGLFCAGSGVGKSTLMARLVGHGAGFLADDAVAVELTGGLPLAHPGPALVHLYERDVPLLGDDTPLRRIEGFRSMKAALAPAAVADPTPIGGLHLLERGEEGGPVRFERIDAVEPFALLSAIFTRSVKTPERLRRHLDVCAAIAERVPVFRVVVPAGTGREAMAEAVWEHLCRP
ncbi:MAG: hypothetical protein HZB46_09700 [Solirubrobacterales bacterium]|nr:hypothetical protein [Solirubrobacterales bacterium]